MSKNYKLTTIEDRSKIRNFIFDKSIYLPFILIGIVLIIVLLGYSYNTNASIIAAIVFVVPFILHALIQFLPHIFAYKKIGTIHLGKNSLDIKKNNELTQSIEITDIKTFEYTYNGTSYWGGSTRIPEKYIVRNYIRFSTKSEIFEFAFISKSKKDKNFLYKWRRGLLNVGHGLQIRASEK